MIKKEEIKNGARVYVRAGIEVGPENGYDSLPMFGVITDDSHGLMEAFVVTLDNGKKVQILGTTESSFVDYCPRVKFNGRYGHVIGKGGYSGKVPLIQFDEESSGWHDGNNFPVFDQNRERIKLPKGNRYWYTNIYELVKDSPVKSYSENVEKEDKGKMKIKKWVSLVDGKYIGQLAILDSENNGYILSSDVGYDLGYKGEWKFSDNIEDFTGTITVKNGKVTKVIVED